LHDPAGKNGRGEKGGESETNHTEKGEKKGKSMAFEIKEGKFERSVSMGGCHSWNTRREDVDPLTN